MMLTFSLLFFNISGAELVIIMLVLFMVFGPSKIPEIAKKLGRALYEVKRASSDIRREIDTEIRRVEKKVDLSTPAKKEEKTEDIQNTEDEAK